MRLYAPQHSIVESKPPDVDIFDLRLSNPFPELLEYVRDANFEVEDSMLHAHIPFVIILLKAAETWKQRHGSMPSTFEQKDQFKHVIREFSRGSHEINFDEAVNRAYLCWSGDDFSQLEALLEDEACDNAGPGSSIFWVVAKAVKQFYQETGAYPLTGQFPDMTSDSVSYITLQ